MEKYVVFVGKPNKITSRLCVKTFRIARLGRVIFNFLRSTERLTFILHLIPKGLLRS